MSKEEYHPALDSASLVLAESPSEAIDAERALLGSVFTYPPLLDDPEFAALKTSAFLLVRHGWIWDAMRRVKDDGAIPDNITVAAALGDRLQETGGPAYLTKLINDAPNSFNAPTYLKLVVEAALRREMCELANQIARGSADGVVPAEALMTASESIDRLLRGTGGGIEIVSSADLIERYNQLDESQVWKVPGLIGKALNLLAGDFGAGKSWVGQDIAIAVATGAMTLGKQANKSNVLYLGFDMAPEEFGRRLDKLTWGRGVDPPTNLNWNFDRLEFDKAEDLLKLESAIRDRNVGLVVVDSANKYMGGLDEMDNADVAKFLGNLRNVANRTGADFLLLHFLRKAGMAESMDRLTDRVRGAGDWVGGTDSSFVMVKTGRGDALSREVVQIKLRGGFEEESFSVGIDDLDDKGTVVTVGASNEKAAMDVIGELYAGMMVELLKENADREFTKAEVIDYLKGKLGNKPSERGFKDATGIVKKVIGVAVYRGRGKGGPNMYLYSEKVKSAE